MRLGVISDLRYEQYGSYYYAAKNIFHEVRLVNSAQDIDGLEAILVGNDHHQGHRDIWEKQDFINAVNTRDIPFYAHTVEHIHSSHYPWNIEIQKNLMKFKKLRQRCWDVDDARHYGTKLARVLISNHYLGNYEKSEVKNEKAIFVGKIYPDRASLLKTVQKFMQVDVVPRLEIPYKIFLSLLGSYKFVFSPLSISSTGIPGRFYEALAVGSFPIQQVANTTLNAYLMESEFNDAIFFKKPQELLEKLPIFTCPKVINRLSLEEEIKGFFDDYC